MNCFTHIVFSFPPDARYLPDELVDEYERIGGSIELYDNVAATVILGDRILKDGRLWTVAELNEYAPVDHSANYEQGQFSVAIATLDGEVPQRDGWEEGGPHYFYVLATDDQGLTDGMPTRLEYMPQVGQVPLGYEDYEIEDVMVFEPVGSYPQGFDQVRVYMCAKATPDAEEITDLPAPKGIAA